MQPTSRQSYPFTVRRNDLEVWNRFPLSWYERTFLYAAVGISIGLMLQLFFWRLWGYLPPSWLSSLAAVCYVVGFLFDFVSTHLHVRLKPSFDDRGLKMNTCEANPLLPAYPTLAQQIWNVSTIFSLLYIPLVAIMPGVGFGAFILHGLAGMGNYRVYQRSLLTLNLFDTCAHSPTKDDGGGHSREMSKSVSQTDALGDGPQRRRGLAPIIKEDDKNDGSPGFRRNRSWNPV